jgi:hypothetical protein
LFFCSMLHSFDFSFLFVIQTPTTTWYNDIYSSSAEKRISWNRSLWSSIWFQMWLVCGGSQGRLKIDRMGHVTCIEPGMHGVGFEGTSKKTVHCPCAENTEFSQTETRGKTEASLTLAVSCCVLHSYCPWTFPYHPIILFFLHYLGSH